MSTFIVSAVWLANFYKSNNSLYLPPYATDFYLTESLVLCANIMSGLSALLVFPLLYVQITNLVMNKTTRERFGVTSKQRKVSTRSHRSSTESEQLIQTERDLLVPLSIDSSAITNGIVFLASRRPCCTEDAGN